MKRLLIFLCFASSALAQQGQAPPLNVESTSNGITQHWTVGAQVSRGQIIKLNSNGLVIPMAVTDTGGAFGVAVTSAPNSGMDLLISIGGTPLVQVDGACNIGDYVSISTTGAGLGHCAATATTQIIGVAVQKQGFSGFINVQLSGFSSSGAPSLASAFVTPPSNCSVGNGPTGVDAQGNALNCNPVLSPTVTNTFTQPQLFKADISCLQGPNPYVDIRCYGARAGNPNSTPYATGLTVSINSGQTNATISSASTFVNGDGVILYGAGPAHAMTTPAAPTIQPALALTGTRTGVVTTTVPTGATTRCYKMVAADKAGGLTAASTETCTTTGAATLGINTVNITSMARSGTTVTVTTAATHGFFVGCTYSTCGEVYIDGGNGLSDFSFFGWYRVASAANGTTFTFNGYPDTNQGATTASTGGIAEWFSADHVIFAAVTGAVRFYIYEGASGAETLINVSDIEGTNTNFTFDYFGSTMSGGFNAPPYVPSSPPGSATSDNLPTTIVSGAGTTSLVLADAAGTTVSGATIRLDAKPGILAAATAISANGGQGTLYIPSVPGNSFVLNSYLNTTGLGYAVSQNGSLVLNETWEAGPSGGGFKWYGDRAPQWRSLPADGWQSNVLINVNTANPGIYISQGFGLHMSGLDISASNAGGNSATLVVAEGGFNQHFDYVTFGTGTGADAGGQDLHLRGSGGQAATNVYFDFVNFQGGVGGTVVSHSPLFYCDGCGTVTMNSVYYLHRGTVFNGVSNLINNFSYINGGGEPLYTTTNPTSPFIYMGLVTLDTFAHPCVANLGPQPPTIIFPSGMCTPASAAPPVTGVRGPIVGGTTLTGNDGQSTKGIPNRDSDGDICGANVFDGFFAQPGVVAAAPYCTHAFNKAVASGANYPIFVNGPAPVAPVCTVNAGGTLTQPATYTFKIIPRWQNGGYGVQSPASNSCSTTSGNQSITVTFTPVNGNPLGYDLFANGQAFSTFTPANPIPANATSMTWSSQGSVVINLGNINVPTGGPTMLMQGNKGIAAPLVQAANLVSNGFACTNAELALSAGWGNTATVTAVAGLNQTCRWTITANGTGIAANPTVTDTLQNALPNASIACTMVMEGGTGAITLFQQTTLSATAPVFTFQGTPVAASTYIVNRRCGP